MPKKLKVYFDLNSHEAIMLDDGKGYRYWLQSNASQIPTI